MNADRLLAHYERVADSPDAIPRLRRFILDLAVRGKLVPQAPNEEPAAELLKRSKKHLSQSSLKASRTDKNEATAPEYDLPPNWLWVRIGDHLELINGMAFKPSDWQQVGIKIVRIQNLNRLDAPFNHCDPKRVRDRFLINDGAFLISWSGTPGTSFGAFIWDRGEAVLNQHIFRCDFRFKAFEPLYLRLAINGRLDEMIAKAHGGVGLQHITKGKLEALLIALPPLAEQHRIVAKVDKMMALCDRLEAARAGREAVRDRLEAASLARLNAPDPNPATFGEHARLALDKIATLTTRPDQIKKIRQTILNLAVRGRLSTEGARRTKPTKLGDVASLQNGYAFKSEWFSKSGTRLLRNTNVGHGVLNWSEEVCLPDIQVPDYERFRLHEGDVVLSLDRPFIVTGTKVARIIAKNDLPALLLQRVGRFVLSPALHPDYLYLWINSPHFSEQIDPGRSNGVPHISSKQVEAAVLFLPPLAEQHRIVAKIDALMALCDRLEASLAAAAATRRSLLDALLAEALAVPQIRELEAAE